MFDTRSGLSFFASLKDAAGAAVLGSDQQKIGSGSALEVAAPEHCSLYILINWWLGVVQDIDITCDGELVPKDHTLKFVQITRWRTKAPPLK